MYRSSSSVACFASAARYEIQIAGRKLVGSAQRRYARPNGEEVVLQHGSVLLGPDHLRMVDFLKSLRENQRERLKNELSSKTMDLGTALGKRIEYDDAVAALKKGFEVAWQISFGSVPSEEMQEVDSIGLAAGE